MFRRHIRKSGWRHLRGFRMPNQFDFHAVGVTKGKHHLTEALFRPLGWNPVRRKPLFPVGDRLGRNAEGRVGNLAGPGSAASRVQPGEKCQDGPRLTVSSPK